MDRRRRRAGPAARVRGRDRVAAVSGVRGGFGLGRAEPGVGRAGSVARGRRLGDAVAEVGRVDGRVQPTAAVGEEDEGRARVSVGVGTGAAIVRLGPGEDDGLPGERGDGDG